MKEKIYFDNAATTPVRKEVMEEILPYFSEFYGNASSVYEIARKSKKALDEARAKVAKALNADAAEIFFTAGGSESDNWAIKSGAELLSEKGNHIITTKIEHHAVLHTCAYLETKGFEITYLPVDEYGQISIEDLKAAIKPSTILITIMFANNEIGTMQPIEEIGCIAREKGVLFHTDAVQAVGHVKIDVKEMKIDMLSLSGHKLGAPKGVGALYVKKGINIKPLIHGGAQERNRRAGTENIPGIVGLGKAIEMAVEEMDEVSKRLIYLRDKLINGITNNIAYSKLNGHPTMRLPGNCNISFEFIEGESMLLFLDGKGIFCSSGSACTSGSLDPSHVLLAIGLPHEKAHGSLRMTLSYLNTEKEIDTMIETLPPIVERLRDMSPLYEDFLKNHK